jgi:Holliday junction resolvase-like predicted endonuclease
VPCFLSSKLWKSQGKNSSEFGEFDAIVASQEKIYLIESKWDHAGKAKTYKQIIKPVQTLRHEILSWYITHWHKNGGNWQKFLEE